MDAKFKIILLGNSGVGKTNIASRYVRNNIDMMSRATIGVGFFNIGYEYEGTNIVVELWDTAGQEKFRSLVGIYYRGTNGIILCYDITNRKSFDDIITSWFSEIDRFKHDNLIITLVGTKCDLVDSRQVEYSEGEELAKKYNLSFFEVSSLQNINIKNTIDILIESIYKNYLRELNKKIENNKLELQKQQLQQHEQDDLSNKQSCCILL